MFKQRSKAAHDVASRLFEAETAIDTAIRCASELAAILPQARQDANLSAIVGQEALESAIAILPALAEARQRIVATHQRLDTVKGQIGLGPVSFGSSGGKPDAGITTNGLRVVEEAA